MTLSDIIILLVFLIEVYVFAKFELRIWKTLYTPLNILMLPYTVVLLITIFLPKSLGFVDFYFPSIFFWMIGLFVFFIPSFLIGIKVNNKLIVSTEFEIVSLSKFVIVFISILMFLSLIHIYLNAGSSVESLGSDEFATENLSGGIWGHIREFLNACLILLIFLIDKAHWKYIFLILGVLVLAMLNQVKSWIIIPLVAGFLFRLYTNRMKLNPLFILFFILIGAGIFFLSYYLLLVFSIQGEFTEDTSEFIYGHFFHYLTSGVNGLSIDMKAGFLELPNPEYIFAPFLNIIYLFTGTELIAPISSVYHDSGLSGTNVLTFFGTLFIHLGILGSVLYVLFFSTFIYMLKWYIAVTKCVFFTAIYSWWCSMLFMGWFEFYFWNFSFIEIPIFYLIIKSLNKYTKLSEIQLK